MDFAPYQDTSPETERALSPPPLGRRSTSFSPTVRSPGPASPALNAPSSFNPWGGGGGGASQPAQTQPTPHGLESGYNASDPRSTLSEFSTSLPIRLDYAAMLAYLIFPPASGVLLLIIERKSDYVRFHAWQSSLLFSFMFILQMIFIWSSFMFWLIFVVDLGLIAWLAYRAYIDADALDRYEVPVFGALASRFLDDE